MELGECSSVGSTLVELLLEVGGLNRIHLQFD